MRIVILGSGRVGSQLANSLVNKNHTLLVVDEKDRKFKSLNEHPDIHRVCGNIFDSKTSDRVFAEKVDVFVVVTGADNVNVMAGQAMQKKYSIPKVLIRIFDPDLAEVYRTLGFQIICPTNYTLAELLKALGGR